MSQKLQLQHQTQRDRVFATNRKAYHDYHILKTIEAGLELTGTEVKSIRAGRVNLRESYARVEDGELWLIGAHISPYDQGNRFNHEPTRPRKLLVHKDELLELKMETQKQGLSIVPLKLYDKGGLIKVELALVKGKKEYDKREAIAKREAEREIARAVRRSEQE